MPTPSKHALLSASSAHRWLKCTAAPHYELNFPNEEAGVYAEEGTLAHSFCELYVNHIYRKYDMPDELYEKRLAELMDNELYDPEMLNTAQQYLDYITLKQMTLYNRRPYIVTEARVDLSDYIPDGFGTCDCIMIGGDTLHITDYKHGKGVAVDAVGNPQMRLYALGALKLYGPIFGDSIKHISMAIVQPRIREDASEDMLTVDELLAWGEEIKPIAKEAYDGPGTFCPGDHCKFCKGRAQCRARALHYAGFDEFRSRPIEGRMSEEEKAARKEAEANSEVLSPVLTDAEIGELLIKADALEAWRKDLQSYAVDAMLKGNRIPGWKLVEGKSNRVISDADKLVDALVTAGYDEAILYNRELKTLTDLEKLVGKKQFGTLSEGCITKPRGKATLAAESDKREEYKAAQAEFKDVTPDG